VKSEDTSSCPAFLFVQEVGPVVYVLPDEDEVFAESELIDTPRPTRRRSQEEEEVRSGRIQAQWEEFLGAGFDVDTLSSVSNLRDLRQERWLL